MSLRSLFKMEKMRIEAYKDVARTKPPVRRHECIEIGGAITVHPPRSVYIRIHVTRDQGPHRSKDGRASVQSVVA